MVSDIAENFVGERCDRGRIASRGVAGGGLKEMREWEPGGEYVTKQLDRIWTKYTGKPGPYALRDPKIDETRVLFVCGIDRIATFGEP